MNDEYANLVAQEKGKRPEDVTPEERREMKRRTFGVRYGVGDTSKLFASLPTATPRVAEKAIQSFHRTTGNKYKRSQRKAALRRRLQGVMLKMDLAHLEPRVIAQLGAEAEELLQPFPIKCSGDDNCPACPPKQKSPF